MGLGAGARFRSPSARRLPWTRVAARAEPADPRWSNSARLDRITPSLGSRLRPTRSEHQPQVVPRESDPEDGDRNQPDEHDQRRPRTGTNVQDDDAVSVASPAAERDAAGEDLRAPHHTGERRAGSLRAIQGPIFRLAKVGPLIGKRTWGGLVGISHDLPLVDGGSVTMPDFGMWDPTSGEWVIENHGVDP